VRLRQHRLVVRIDDQIQRRLGRSATLVLPDRLWRCACRLHRPLTSQHLCQQPALVFSAAWHRPIDSGAGYRSGAGRHRAAAGLPKSYRSGKRARSRRRATGQVARLARQAATAGACRERLVHEGKFRGDLYSRIDATSVVLPPLDERPVDIVVLAEHFLGRRRCLHPRALQDLLRHSWRYGVRDLRAVMTLPVCRPAFAIATSALRWLPFGGSISTATARAA